MRRGIVALVMAMALVAGGAATAAADAIDDEIATLRTAGYKARLSAALTLSKSTDDRAIAALADALRDDADASVRRVAALALGKTVSPQTGRAARDRALAALERAAAKDKDKKVRAAAASTLASLKAMLSTKAPKVFVHVDAPKDKSRKASRQAVAELDKAVRAEVRRASKDYATEWPGELPTGAELARLGTRAFIVAAAVTKVTQTKVHGKTEIACTIEIRVAPWEGADGAERWAAHQAGKATGSGKAITGSTDGAIAAGVVDCVAAVGEQLTGDKVVPFIRSLAK